VGIIIVPMSTRQRKPETEFILAQCEAVGLIYQGDLAEHLPDRAALPHLRECFVVGAGPGASFAELTTRATAPAVAIAEEEIFSLLYTSGTTGRPKGAMLTHRNLGSNALVLHAAWGFRPGDVLIHMLPLFHVHGLFVACHCVLANGSAMRFHAKFDARVALAEFATSTVFMGVPTFYTRLLAEPGLDRKACASMRLFVSGSAPLLAETHVEFEERSGHRILERYGMTETGMLTSNPLAGERRAGSVGPPLAGTEVRIVDDDDAACAPGAIGHVLVKGANVFKGYWRMPEKNRDEFTTDGFFRTGDMGSVASDGYLTIVGRSKDLIITGGYNVYPKEIELALDELPGVRESAVVGVPHPDFGEAVTAVIVARAGEAAPTESQVIAALKGKLANFKVPKRVHFVEDLPRNAMGKVQKNLLRERFAAG
jgi:malonyl-CoA/methylmalonyl-CoA synthetase